VVKIARGCFIMRLAKAMSLACALLTPQAIHADTCQILRFGAGFTTGDLNGSAPQEGEICYDLRFPTGQNLSIELVGGQNVSVSAPGYFDARSDRIFLGDLPGQIELRVFQLMRAPSPQPFALRIRFEPPGNG
jgi:hypothetical protein